MRRPAAPAKGRARTHRALFREEGEHPCSLVHAWFKPNKPLPRHSHDSDCLYYVISGVITMGNQVLGPGDGFHVPAGQPYAYRVGPQGAEVLEFRTAARFDMRLHDDRPERWDQLVEAAVANGDAWRTPSVPPSWVVTS